MKNKNIKDTPQPHPQDKNNPHPDCQSCKKQKLQNQALLQIYQKLQAIDANSKTLRKSLQKHKNEFQATESKFREFSGKVDEVRVEGKEGRERGKMEGLGDLGELLEKMVGEAVGGGVVRENWRLRKAIVQMHKSNPNTTSNQSKTMRSMSVSTSYEPQPNPSQQTPNFSPTPKPTQQLQKRSPSPSPFLQSPNPTKPQPQQQTQTTGFFSLSPQTEQIPKISGLNLWLYQQSESRGIEEELYETRATRVTRFRGKGIGRSKGKPGGVLPAIGYGGRDGRF